jgi:hypothetical protein
MGGKGTAVRHARAGHPRPLPASHSVPSSDRGPILRERAASTIRIPIAADLTGCESGPGERLHANAHRLSAVPPIARVPDGEDPAVRPPVPYEEREPASMNRRVPDDAPPRLST